MPTEITQRAHFDRLRYAQCWEDSEILLEALNVQREGVYLSIASGGDNTLAILSQGPKRVIAVDLNPAQIACLELRVAAYRALSYQELLGFTGSRVMTPPERLEYYQRCRPFLSDRGSFFWDRQLGRLAREGLGGVGKFELYLAWFRRFVLPLIHGEESISQLLESKSFADRLAFYDQNWDTCSWRSFFRLFFSRLILGWGGRDPSFFKYVQGNVGNYLLDRTRYACTILNPAENPYFQWIATGHHPTTLPYSLTPASFEGIRNHLDRLEWYCLSLEDFLDNWDNHKVCINGYNLSNIFEYMSVANYEQTLRKLIKCSVPGSRLVYWNLLVPRDRPASLANYLQPLGELSQKLAQQDKGFFYSNFVVEETKTISGRGLETEPSIDFQTLN